jgi:hypothetical protein
LQAEFDRRYEIYKKDRKDFTVALMQSWLRNQASLLGIDIADAGIKVSRLRLRYTDPMLQLGHVVPRSMRPLADAFTPSHGFVVSIDHPSGKWEYFVCTETLMTYAISPGGAKAITN